MRGVGRLNAPQDPEAGYTLTEMLVVIGIIGLIAAVLTPALIGQMSRARAKAAQLQLETVASQLEMYMSDVGRYPTGEEGLAALVAPPPGADGWTGPYVRDAKALNDPWGRPLVYKTNGDARGFQVVTLGADGKAGGRGADRDLGSPTDTP